jgi:hypothetical protein
MRKRIIVGILMGLFLLQYVSAFGVSTIYSNNFPLRLRPGEEKETFFLLSNVIEGDNDVVINVDLVAGGEIAHIVSSTHKYSLSQGTEAEVPITIKIPRDALPGSEYRVGAIFKPAPMGQGVGNVQFLVNIGKSFPVKIIRNDEDNFEIEEKLFSLTVEEQPEQVVGEFSPDSNNSGFLWLIGIIVFLIVAILIAIIIIIVLTFRGGRQVQVPAGFVQQPAQYQGSVYSGGDGQNTGGYGQSI